MLNNIGAVQQFEPAQRREIKMIIDLFECKWMHENGAKEGACGPPTIGPSSHL